MVWNVSSPQRFADDYNFSFLVYIIARHMKITHTFMRLTNQNRAFNLAIVQVVTYDVRKLYCDTIDHYIYIILTVFL